MVISILILAIGLLCGGAAAIQAFVSPTELHKMGVHLENNRR
jgi:hypothetical protein